MKRVSPAAILYSLYGALFWGLVLYVISGTLTFRSYLQAYEQTEAGDSIYAVLRRFGQPSRIYGLLEYPGDSGRLISMCGECCTLQLEYDLPFTMGINVLAIDFDARHKVIRKVEMSSP
jgi:hypothetical protein